ncbi:MAG: carnitine dehydratase [Candidatus Eremiobacteraeota bacterium]|nr:carnitine dehydratase [Candidatus Eremiobacteraeota bacterium]
MLEGVRILDLTWVLGGPYGSQLLAQLGAEVIKIEPLAGDLARTIPPYFVDGDSSFFLSVNRGKRSLALDLKTSAGMEVLHDLVRASDAMVYNFAPGVPVRLGIDHAALLRINPRFSVGELIGLHDEGEYRNAPAFDVVIQALAGTMDITGDHDGSPSRVGFQIADLAGGLFMALGLAGALLRAYRTGAGQYVQVSLLDAQLALLTWQAQNYLVSGNVPVRTGARHPMIAPSDAFTGSDGAYFVISPTGEAFWQKFCTAIDRDDLAADERFATAGARIANVDALGEELAALFRTKPAAAWLELLEGHRVPAAPINTVAEALAHPLVALRGMLERVPRAGGAAVPFLGNPFKFAGAPDLAYPPHVGEHTTAILRDVCGYDDARIARLASEGAISEGVPA